MSDSESPIRRLSYAESLCLTMLKYSALECKITADELKEKLEFFFSKEMIDDMINLIITEQHDVIFTALTPA